MLSVLNGAAITYGHLLVNTIEGVRQNIGLCSEFYFYDTLAGLTGSELREENLRLIEKVDLKEKIHCASKALIKLSTARPRFF